MQRFVRGDFLPDFGADSNVNPNFAFGTLGGRQVILVFIGSAGSPYGRSLVDALLQQADWLAYRRILVYLVTADRKDRSEGRLDHLPNRYTVFWDFDRSIHRLYGMVATPADAAPGVDVMRVGAFLVRENLRLHATIAPSPVEDFGARIRSAAETLPPLRSDRPVSGQAPILLVPEVVDRTFCTRLIEYYETHGGSESGFMRDVSGATRGVHDGQVKRRKDCYIQDEDLQRALRQAIVRRVIPEIEKAFVQRMTRIERYVISCYDETDQGFFKPHRDNRTKATAHRKFAMSLNLNSEEYEGGSLRFPEYGPYTYKPETGGAAIFSCSLLHEAMPVTKGRRFVVLPFLYDEQGANDRADGFQYLDPAPATLIEDLTAA